MKPFPIVLIIILFAIYACKKEPIVPQEGTINSNSFILAGQIDSCKYFSFQTPIEIKSAEPFYGNFISQKSIDIDSDLIYDFTVTMNERIDTSSNYYSIRITIESINGIYFNTNPGQDYYNSLNTYTKNEQMIGTDAYDQYGKLFETSTYQADQIPTKDTCCGEWDLWNKDFYIMYFNKSSQSIGWIRAELKLDEKALVIKDAALKIR